MRDDVQPETPALTNRAVYLRFLPYLRPYWKQACVMIVMVLGQVAMGVLEPWPIKFLFDNVIGHHHVRGVLGRVTHALVGNDRLGLLNLIVVAFVILEILNGVFSYIGSLLISTVGQKFVW